MLSLTGRLRYCPEPEVRNKSAVIFQFNLTDLCEALSDGAGQRSATSPLLQQLAHLHGPIWGGPDPTGPRMVEPFAPDAIKGLFVSL